MLLTINNLPSHTRYTDVKALIQSKCGPLEVILDNLVTKNKFKSVTVGLADEGDAAILVRKMNGLFMDGVQIYVEDPRQNKRKEQQPFRSSETFSQPPQDNSEQLPLGFQNLGAHAMDFTGQPQGVMPMMPFNQSMMTYGMPTYGMYVPQPGQNAGFMGYGQPMMQNMPGGSQMQNQNLYENLDMSNTFQGANQEQRNDFVQGTGDYQPDAKKSRWESEHKQRSENSDRNPRFRDRSPQDNRGNYRGQQDSRNSKHRKSGFNSTSTNRDDSRNDPNSNRNDRPSFANQHARNSSNVSQERYSGNRSSHNKGGRTSSQQASNYKGSGSEIIPSLFDIPPLAQGDYREQEKMNYEPHYNENPNLSHDYQYRDRPEFAGETRNPSLLPEYGQRSAQPEPHFADNSEAYQDYREKQYEAPFETNREPGREPYSPTRNEYDNYDLDRPKPLDPWASDNNFDRHVPQKRNYDDRERRFNDDPYDTPRPGHRQNDWADNRSKNFDDSRRSRSKFHESEEVRGDWRNQNPPQRDPKPSFTRRGEPGPSREPRSFQDRHPPLKSQFKARDDRRGPRNVDGKQKPVESKFNTTRTGGNRPVAPNTERSRSLTKRPNDQGPKKNGSQKKLPGPTKPEKPAPKPQSNQQPSLKTLINKDTTYRGQATSQIAKEMINNLQIHKGESHTILKPLKLSIRARLELILGENMVTSVEEVVEQYRQKFSKKEDAAFFDVVLQKYEKDQTAVPSTKEKANGGAAAAAGVSSQASQKKPAQPPASKPGSASKIPKFPNADKNVMKQQKKQAKMEFNNEDMYELQEPLNTALKEEIDAMCELFNSYECADEDEKKITNIIKNKATKDFRKAVQLNATKRILNINTNLLVRIFVHGKLPKGDGLLNAFLKDFGVESCRKNKSGTFFVASCKTFESYDKLLTLGSTNLGGCNISIKPLHLAGFKSRPSKDAVKKSRAAFIRRQIEDVDQSNAIEDSVECNANDNPDDFEDY